MFVTAEGDPYPGVSPSTPASWELAWLVEAQEIANGRPASLPPDSNS